MNDRFTSMRIFVRVARTGSLSAAARELGMTQPTMSRTMTALEQQIGVALLTRSTRHVTLTEAGTEYLARSEMILAALEEADQAVRGTEELRGTLRIATSPVFASRTLMPRLGGFSDRHPKLRIEFVLDDARSDLIGDSVDVAVRIGFAGDANVLVRSIATVRRVLVASPAYLSKAGVPTAPADLHKHALVAGPPGRGSQAWTFRRNADEVSLRVQPRFLIDSTDAATAATVAGLGICSTGHTSVDSELQSGALAQLLPDWDMGTADVSVILPAGRAAKASARAFADFIAKQLKEP
ncbi:LysR family transcriptional regulator [Variovorax paradoxus]|uniref:LysR family transcriptional regulator n=1 Tax=Variovorax paradoxus TaxID=34073 RepID=A0A0D0LDL4_VARPD|nr:LysR family transcriptional regulator [Variovorax paradoxus]KIQ36262.1 LysR family transcriptional regulator [Variovorax paradoxus]